VGETMEFQTKSILIARKKRVDPDDYNYRPCYISLFDKNNPHLSTEGPKKVIEFERMHKILINGLKIEYLLPGNDILINNLKKVTIEEGKESVSVTGIQEE
jgi:hypothetical protein